MISNSPDHNAKGTRSGPCGPSHSLSAHGFRFSFTRHQACFSPFPHGTSALSVADEYLALEGGPPGFRQGSSVPPPYSGTRVTRMRKVRLQGSHLLRRAVPGRFDSSTHDRAGYAPHRPYNPEPPKESGLGSSAFARRYLRNLAGFLFLQVLRCFSSLRSLLTPMYSKVRYLIVDTWNLRRLRRSE